jgi:uncharacterized protein YprB with RNaseH-like and TPR domain
MGLNYDGLADVSPIVIDIETCGLPNAADYLEPVQADKRLKDPEKVKADLVEKEQARLERLSLDWNVGRIAALGFWTDQLGVVAYECRDEIREAEVITAFWSMARNRTIVGFNIKGFDLRFLVQRSRYLGLVAPSLDFSKYSRKGIHDLYLDLTFGDGTYDQGAMRRTLSAFCKRFGIAVSDDTTGADIPKLVEAGAWDKVLAHVQSDVAITVELARRLGVIRPALESVSA